MKKYLKISSCIAAAFFLLLGINPSSASTLYTSGFAGGMNTPGYGSSLLSWTDANSFSLAANGTLVSVSFAALDCCFFDWSGTINYTLFTNNGYLPSSTPFAQGSTTSYLANVTYQDGASNKITDYQFNLVTPVALQANTTYWLGINMSNFSGADGSGWNSCYNCGGLNSNSQSTGGVFDWGLNAGQGAFSLSDTAVQTTPEPETLWLLLPGLTIVGLLSFRRQRTLVSEL